MTPDRCRYRRRGAREAVTRPRLQPPGPPRTALARGGWLGPDPAADLRAEGRRDRPEGGVDLGFGQGSIIGLEGQPIGQALFVERQGLAPIDVEEANLRQQSAAGRPD